MLATSCGRMRHCLQKWRPAANVGKVQTVYGKLRAPTSLLSKRAIASPGGSSSTSSDWLPRKIQLPSLAEWLAVAPFAVLGCNLRVTMGSQTEDLVSFGHDISTWYSANVLGSFVIGLVAGLPAGPSWATKAVHRGITVGFCGCLTTYSSWIVDACAKREESWSPVLTDLVATLSTCACAWHLGRFQASWVLNSGCSALGEKLHTAGWHGLARSKLLLILGGATAYLAYHFHTGSEDIFSALMHSVPGAWLRMALAVLLNGSTFFLGTLTANLTACAMLAEVKAAALGGSAAYGFMTGFCGSLSTVSSFVNDFMSALSRGGHTRWIGRGPWVYILLTLLPGAAIAVNAPELGVSVALKEHRNSH